MHELSGPDDARRMVNFWADNGATSFKAYMNITREELRAAAEEAHKRRLKVTGHLCSVGFREAAEAGIDNLEHGFVVDTEFTPGKKPDECPAGGASSQEFLALDANGAQMQSLFRFLIEHHVAITSTLPVFEQFVPGRPPLRQRVLDAMLPEARSNCLTARVQVHADPQNGFAAIFKKEMELEYAFVKAGGLLLNGPDPSGIGGTLPGFGDQRGVELLVEAGFTPLEAIRIATLNGAGVRGQGGFDWFAGGWQGSGHGGDSRRSFREHQRHREGGDRVQGRRGLRCGEVAGLGAGNRRDPLETRSWRRSAETSRGVSESFQKAVSQNWL